MIVPQPVTVDQVIQLREDNVVGSDAKGLVDLGIEPTSLQSILPSYLWQFRPDGQYSEITRSARNLRG